MKQNSLGLSIFLGGLFSTFVTSVFVLIQTVPAMIGQGNSTENPLGQAVTVWFVLTFAFSLIFQEWQNTLEEYNKRGRQNRDQKSDSDDDSGQNPGN